MHKQEQLQVPKENARFLKSCLLTDFLGGVDGVSVVFFIYYSHGASLLNETSKRCVCVMFSVDVGREREGDREGQERKGVCHPLFNGKLAQPCNVTHPACTECGVHGEHLECCVCEVTCVCVCLESV